MSSGWKVGQTCTVSRPDFVAGQWFSQQHNDWRPVQQIFTNIVHLFTASARSFIREKSILHQALKDCFRIPRHTETHWVCNTSSSPLRNEVCSVFLACCGRTFSLSLPSFKMHCRFPGNVTVIRTRPLAKCHASWTADAPRAGLRKETGAVWVIDSCKVSRGGGGEGCLLSASSSRSTLILPLYVFVRRHRVFTSALRSRWDEY